MTDRYAVIGNPIAHSKSPLIHSRFAELTGQDISYTRIEAPLDGFAATLREFAQSGGRGVNVTAPFKLQAFDAATECSARARRAGAVNAIACLPDGRLLADNFDGLGLRADLERNLGVTLAGRRVLLLGAGGAARGALEPLCDARPATLVVANRTAAKAQALATEAAAFAENTVVGCGLDALGGQVFDVIINATSASQGDALPSIAASVFGRGCIAYDMVYGRGLTPFLRMAREAGVERLADGAGMLVEQAAEAFAWWRGVRPATRAVIDEIAVPLV